SNSISSGNSDADCSGDLTSAGYNVINNTSGCSFDGDTTGDQLGTDAKLGPLQDNGGPTPTQALAARRPAPGQAHPAAPRRGDPACEQTDQRNVTRPQGPQCDVGAFEACAGGGSAGGSFPADSSGGGFTACQGSCGNGSVDAGEKCDDGAKNGTPGDSCDAHC